MHMNYITTTELRTKSSSLVRSLFAGESIQLMHRSRIIGEIRPKRMEGKPFDAKKVLELAKKMNLPKLTYTQREKIYRKHLEEKYGRNLS